MRVIAGTAKGRPLRTVKGREIRPTSDRVKETLFNILMPRVSGSRFLDLFAGSGGVGIEALSRGAGSALFVELLTPHLRVIEANLAATGLSDQAEVIRRDARAAITDLARRGRRFDLIFVDPPYGQGLVDETLILIESHDLLSAEGWVVCEHHKKDLVPAQVTGPSPAGGLVRFRELLCGETTLSLYHRANSIPDGGHSG